MKKGVYVRPATHAGGPQSADPNAPPYGVRFRLKSDFDESNYSGSEKVILKALKTFGMLLADGGEVPLTFADDPVVQVHDPGLKPALVQQFKVKPSAQDLEAPYIERNIQQIGTTSSRFTSIHKCLAARGLYPMNGHKNKVEKGVMGTNPITRMGIAR